MMAKELTKVIKIYYDNYHSCHVLTNKFILEEEEQLLQLCCDKKAPISQFAALLDLGARLNIHDEVDHSTTNSIIVVCSK